MRGEEDKLARMSITRQIRNERQPLYTHVWRSVVRDTMPTRQADY